jgi:large subunit ribosomal protein L10
MPLSKQKKHDAVERLSADIQTAESVVFINFHSLSVGDADVVRTGLQDGGVSYRVIKKTLARRVLEGAGYTGTLPPLEGELALAWGMDAVAPARGIHGFTRKFKDSLSIIGGVFEGAFQDKAAMNEIATIPSTQVLYGQFANLINSPIQRFVFALNQIAEQKDA